jgi:hypothetical protein
MADQIGPEVPVNPPVAEPMDTWGDRRGAIIPFVLLLAVYALAAWFCYPSPNPKGEALMLGQIVTAPGTDEHQRVVATARTLDGRLVIGLLPATSEPVKLTPALDGVRWASQGEVVRVHGDGSSYIGERGG